MMKWAILLLLLLLTTRPSSSFLAHPHATITFLKQSTAPPQQQQRLLVLCMSNDDGEALQALFSKQCDDDGLMTKQMLQKVPAIQELLDEEDLLPQELQDIWEAAPKFPSLDEEERIDVDSFIQIYRDIDDLFEEDLEEEQQEQVEVEALQQPDSNDAEEEELERTFASICDKDGLISKRKLREWNEIQTLLTQELLGDDEFEAIWQQTLKSPGSSDQLDVEGFLSFNVALDDLFVFDEDDNDDEDDEEERSDEPVMVEGDDLPPGVLFGQLANEDTLVGMSELSRWKELQEMLADEELLPLELQNIYDGIPKAANDNLDEEGFLALYQAIDSLFEDDEEEEQTPPEPPKSEAKTQLVALLAEINSDGDRLPCGLESTNREEKLVLDIVNELEKSPSNLVQQMQGNVQLDDMAGSWELLYSSSSAMKFNKGLSGLGGSVPNGKFAGLVQNLQASKYMTDVEYIERIEMNPSSASFDVRVTGDWDLRKSVSLFTGAPSTVMTVEPARVMYGPTSTKADHWKSLGPMNMLDVTYLDNDLRVMRGNTATDNIFVFQRIS